MLPTKTGSTSPCANISSNCVIWQGPDIPCIGLCNGDTVSDVIAKLAEKLCDILDGVTAAEPDLSGLNLACTLPAGQAAPDTIAETIQLIVDYVCNLQPAVSPQLPTLNLPACLHYDTPSGAVTALRLDLYAEYLANRICSILSSIAIIETTIANHESRLVILENCVLPCAPKTPSDVEVISSCVLAGEGLVPLSDLTLALETRFCNLESAVGVPALISNAINSQQITGTNVKVSAPGNYGSDAIWVPNPSTLAHSVQNAWTVIYDLYNAVKDIQLNCCPGACDSIVYNYTTSVNKDSLNVPVSVALSFTGASAPAGYSDCGGSTNVVVTDINGASTSSVFSFSTIAGTANQVTIPLAGLNVYDNLNVSIAFCLTDGVNTCRETVNKTVNLSVPCPADIQALEIAADSVSVRFTNTLGTGASYIINIINANTGLAVATRNITSPPITISETFSGLTQNTPYVVRVTTQISGKQSVCSDVSFTTLEESIPCDAGLDVAIIMDYTGSMGGNIEAAKDGAASLVSVIDSASGSNFYRMGLVIVDEVGNGANTAYASNTEYTSLPTSQKYVNTTGTPNSDIYITAMAMFANDNGTTFQTQLDKLNNTIPLGSGVNAPEPMDRALDLVINQNFLGAYRTGIAKYAILIADDAPSGLDDNYNDPAENDDAFINSLKATCIAQGIKVIVLGSSASLPIYQSLATDTGGTYDTSFDSASIADAIENACGSSLT
jgi:hypothetical protein